MIFIEGTNINYTYEFDDNPDLALKDIHISIQQGEFVTILGHNGCGKSTLVKHFNALLPIQDGTLTVAGLDASSQDSVWKLRRLCGMVFQNPDNQFVSSVVNEDIAFGLNNYGVPKNDILSKIDAALSLVGMKDFEQCSTHMLSGGQKQRIALAGVLALEPQLLIFDEATSMLDADGRKEILSLIKQLHETEQKTILYITHYVEEAVLADKVYILKDGGILASGSPHEILTNQELLLEAGLLPPLPVRLFNDLKDAGFTLPHCPLTNQELAEQLCQLL